MSKEKLRVIPLGGLGEIGKNMMLLEYGDDIIAVDAGVMFPDEEMLGVDLVIPDMTYLREKAEKFRGIAVTHGHEDHIGALPYVLGEFEAPVYASRLTHGLIRVKLQESKGLKDAPIEEIRPGERIRMGKFDVEFFRVCHSIPDAMGVAIRTPVGTVIHTGDFKFDHTPVDGRASDLAKLASFGSEGVALLMSDSTYAEVQGFTPSEQLVGETMLRVIGQAEGRVIVATFASLISRVQQIAEAAIKHNRRIAIVGRSMVENVQMALKLGYLKFPEGTLARIDEVEMLPPNRVVIITTGAQGEPTSALVRMANEEHREVALREGDTVIISATPIPGNETLVHKTVDNLLRLGVKVINDRMDTVHVHGHAAQEELKTMISLTKPKHFVPIHGEYRHLVAHAAIAKSLGISEKRTFIMEDGDVLELDHEHAHRHGRVQSGPIYVDGLGRWETESVVLRDRRMLSKDGIVVVFLVVDSRTSRPVRKPEIVSYGFLEEEESQVLTQAKGLIIETLSHDMGQVEIPFVQTKVKEALGQFFYKATKRRPMIIPVAMGL